MTLEYFVRVDVDSKAITELRSTFDQVTSLSFTGAYEYKLEYQAQALYWDEHESCLWWATFYPVPPQIGWDLIVPDNDPFGMADVQVNRVVMTMSGRIIVYT